MSDMDDRLAKALEHANYRATLATAKKNLELKYQNGLIFAHNGGSFTVTKELINFVDYLIRQDNDEAVLVDDRNNPIRIDDLETFLSSITSVYYKAVNSYYAEYEKLRKARNVKTIVGDQ